MDEDHTFILPKEPWTYGNESFNPDLHPGSSNGRLRERRGSPASRQRHTYPYPGEDGGRDGTYPVPPYHPDYDGPQPSYEHRSRPPYADEDEDEDDRHYDDRPQSRQFIRRGSEGYEVRPINREEMMMEYLDSRPHLAAFARAQERVDPGEEGDNYGVSDEDEGGKGDDRPVDDEEMEREVMERLGEAGRYRPYVPERWESDDEVDGEVEQVPNGLPVHD